MSASELQQRIAALEAERDLEVQAHSIRMSNFELRISQLRGAASLLLQSELDLTPGAFVYNVRTHQTTQIVEGVDVPKHLVATSRIWENLYELQQDTNEQTKLFFELKKFAIPNRRCEAYIITGDKFKTGFVEMCTYHGWNKITATDVRNLFVNHFPIKDFSYARYNSSWILSVVMK